MRKLFLFATAIFLLVIVLISHSNFAEPPMPQVTAPATDLTTAATDNNTFALDLYSHLSSTAGNLFFSPYSIESALAMAYGGARAQTAAQMKQALHLSLPDDRLHSAIGNLSANINAGGKGVYTIENANAIWTQSGYSYNPAFLDLLKNDYAADLHQTNFATQAGPSAQEINQWVAQKTRGKIPDILSPDSLSAQTRMVLVNAIYFKGNWQSQFEKGQTEQQLFHLNSHENASAQLMHHAPQELGYDENNDLQLVDVPYVNNELSMLILLPRNVDGLANLEKKLTNENLRLWTDKMDRRQVEVYLPKFKMDSKFDLNDVLSSMGMIDAFDSHKADFSGMTSQDRLYISDVVHKAFVDVNEEGTEAAAATAVVMNRALAVVATPSPVIFRADHPFIFAIRQKGTGAILFLGRITRLEE